MKILGTGLSGLVGKRVVEVLSADFSFENLSLETGVDITNKEVISEHIGRSPAPWVFHFAAITDVDACEKEKNLKEKSRAWQVNVLATEQIAHVCQKNGKKLLYISTDYVFDGKKDSYTEEDVPRPVGWYAITKYEGEKRVGLLGKYGLVIRIANPYKALNDKKVDFVHRILEKLVNKVPIFSPTDQIFVPTFIDDIGRAIGNLIKIDADGLYHVVGSQALSPFTAAQKIARVFNYAPKMIQKTTFAEYFLGRAPRPFQANLKNDKIAKLGIKMSAFDEGLAKIKQQL